MADLRPQVTSTPAGGGWWQRNRWALLLLPFVVALILGLGAYRVHAFWWTSGLHEPSHAPVGGSSTLPEPFVAAQGEHSRTVTMGAGPAAVVTAYPGLSGEEQSVEEVPGTRVWHVQLQVEAAPDQVLSGCRVEIVDDRGRTFRVLHGDIGWELPRTSAFRRVHRDRPTTWVRRGVSRTPRHRRVPRPTPRRSMCG